MALHWYCTSTLHDVYPGPGTLESIKEAPRLGIVLPSFNLNSFQYGVRPIFISGISRITRNPEKSKTCAFGTAFVFLPSPNAILIGVVPSSCVDSLLKCYNVRIKLTLCCMEKDIQALDDHGTATCLLRLVKVGLYVASCQKRKNK